MAVPVALTLFLMVRAGQTMRMVGAGDDGFGAQHLSPYAPGQELISWQYDAGDGEYSTFFPGDGSKTQYVKNKEVLVYEGAGDEERKIKVRWVSKGLDGQVWAVNTRSVSEAHGTSPWPGTTHAPDTPTRPGVPTAKPGAPTAKPSAPTAKPSAPTAGQKPLVVAKNRHGYTKCRFHPSDGSQSPDPTGIDNGQVLQCLDEDCKPSSHGSHITVLFRGVRGTMSRQDTQSASPEDYSDFYDPHVLLGPCGVRLARPSQDEMKLLERLMVVHDPEKLGKGADVKDPRPDYNSLKIRSAWKVLDRSPKLKEYLQRVDGLNAQRADSWVTTLFDKENHESRDRGWLGKNEYWMVRGADPIYTKSLVCDGGAWAAQGMFAHGIFLADAADKMDQYVLTDKNAEGLAWALDSTRDDLVDSSAQQSSGLGKTDVQVAHVMRTFLGRHVEYQMERGRANYWRDPSTGQDKTTATHVHKPPFDGEFDSMKIVCAAHKTEEHPGCEKRGGNYPYRWSEYIKPGTGGFQPEDDDTATFVDTAAVKYLVVYDRIQE